MLSIIEQNKYRNDGSESEEEECFLLGSLIRFKQMEERSRLQSMGLQRVRHD